MLAGSRDERAGGVLEALGELLERHVGADEQRVAGVHAPPGGEVAEDHLGPLSQPGVDPDLLAVDVDRARALPARVCGRLAARGGGEGPADP